jgi:hypothetical protein
LINRISGDFKRDISMHYRRSLFPCHREETNVKTLFRALFVMSALAMLAGSTPLVSQGAEPAYVHLHDALLEGADDEDCYVILNPKKEAKQIDGFYGTYTEIAAGSHSVNLHCGLKTSTTKRLVASLTHYFARGHRYLISRSLRPSSDTPLIIDETKTEATLGKLDSGVVVYVFNEISDQTLDIAVDNKVVRKAIRPYQIGAFLLPKTVETLSVRISGKDARVLSDCQPPVFSKSMPTLRFSTQPGRTYFSYTPFAGTDVVSFLAAQTDNPAMSFNTLAKSVQSTQVLAGLPPDAALRFYAPTDSAFAAFKSDMVDSDLLRSHIAHITKDNVGEVNMSNTARTVTYQTLNQTPLIEAAIFGLNGKKLTRQVNGKANIPAECGFQGVYAPHNSIIVPIDAVLTP